MPPLNGDVRQRMQMVTHTGGCHCGRVRFEVVAPSRLTVSNCNCSICTKSGYRHLLVPAARFKLLSGQEALTTRNLQCVTRTVATGKRPMQREPGRMTQSRALPLPDSPLQRFANDKAHGR